MSGCEALATKVELNALKAQLEAALNNKLDKSQKQSIVQQSVADAIGTLRPEILIAQGIASAAAQTAADALGIGRAAQGIAQSAFVKAQSAASNAANAAGTAAKALARVMGLIASVAGLAASVATLLVLGNTIDAVERYVDSIGNAANDAYGKALSASATANQALAQRAIPGAKGERGERGLQGIQGATGARGAQGIQGARGAQGIQGATGARGLQGERGIPGVRGEQGLQGIQGVMGLPGAPGVPGVRGEQGLHGAPGARGLPGERGIPGARGEQGLQGIPGARGLPGEQGIPGVRGEQGLQGIPGARGLPGERGIPGVRGEQGLQGIPGVRGEQGLQGVAGAAGLQGTQGSPGARGEPGQQGSPGARGEQGLRGQSGVRGEQGLQGIQGIPGVKGDKGDPGVAGRDVDSALLSTLQGKISELERQLRGQDAVNQQAIALIQALPVTLAQNSTFQAAATSAAAAGTCRTTQPGGCLSNQFNNLNNNFNSGLQGLLQKLDLILQAGQGALLNTINGTVNTINTKLGAEITGGIGGALLKTKERINKVGEFLQIDRLLNILIWWQTLHNAFMLSNNIATTLTSTLSQALAALPGNSLLGIPTEQEGGSPLDIGAQINTMFESAVKGAIGADNYTTIKAEWAKANRIYQAAANLLFSVQSIMQGVQSMVEVTGEYTGKIGNALKSFGMVGEKAYNWMSEKMNTRTALMEKLESNLQAASSMAGHLESVVSSVVTTQAAITELKTQKTEFDSAIQSMAKSDRSDNTVVQGEADASKLKSQSPETAPTDLEKVVDNPSAKTV